MKEWSSSPFKIFVTGMKKRIAIYNLTGVIDKTAISDSCDSQRYGCFIRDMLIPSCWGDQETSLIPVKGIFELDLQVRERLRPTGRVI